MIIVDKRLDVPILLWERENRGNFAEGPTGLSVSSFTISQLPSYRSQLYVTLAIKIHFTHSSLPASLFLLASPPFLLLSSYTKLITKARLARHNRKSLVTFKTVIAPDRDGTPTAAKIG